VRLQSIFWHGLISRVDFQGRLLRGDLRVVGKVWSLSTTQPPLQSQSCHFQPGKSKRDKLKGVGRNKKMSGRTSIGEEKKKRKLRKKRQEEQETRWLFCWFSKRSDWLTGWVGIRSRTQAQESASAISHCSSMTVRGLVERFPFAPTVSSNKAKRFLSHLSLMLKCADLMHRKSQFHVRGDPSGGLALGSGRPPAENSWRQARGLFLPLAVSGRRLSHCKLLGSIAAS